MKRMKMRLLSTWESIRTSLWFVPTVMLVAAIGLSFGMTWLSAQASLTTGWLGVLSFPAGAEGARLLLSTIAGSTITVVGVAFSITIAAVTLTSSQFGPRLLRSFMADKGNQVVLGTYLGTFVYSLLVLRTIQENAQTTYVPEIAVLFAIVLALISFGTLIYFFHHTAASIQAERVVEVVYRELIEEIDRTFPPALPEREVLHRRDEPDGHVDLGGARVTVTATGSGYLRAVDVESLLALATAHDVTIRLLYRPGHFVFEQTPLAVASGKERPDDDLENGVRSGLVLGKYRSLEQDVEFPIQQLVDMALRALSPGINDPYTAVNCIDRLGAAICHLNARQCPSRYRHDEGGRLRLIVEVPTYEGLVDAAFNQIRQNAAPSAAVTIRLLEALQAIAVTTRREEQRRVVRRPAEMIYRAGSPALTEKKDRDDLEERFQAVMEKLGPKA
jgi:uncharacterized membrane protein